MRLYPKIISVIMKVVRNMCEIYYCHDEVFCPCFGLALRASPTSKRQKERLRHLHLGFQSYYEVNMCAMYKV